MQLVAHRCNTLERAQAAQAAGVARLEFDLCQWDDRLWIAHDPLLRRRDTPPAEVLLEALAGLGLPLTCDLKSGGAAFAARAGALLHELAPGGELIVCSHRWEDAVRAARLAGGRAGWSLPQVDVPDAQVPVPTSEAQFEACRTQLPQLATVALADRDVDVLAVRHEFITRELVQATHAAGGQLHAWTLGDSGQGAELTAWGVDALTVERW